MMNTMFAMAVMQTIIAVITLITGMAGAEGSSTFEIIAVNGFFITLFILAASLFSYTIQDRNDT